MAADGRPGLPLLGGVALALAATGLVAIMLYAVPGRAAGVALADGILLLAALGAMAAFIRRAGQDAAHRRIWTLLAAAAVLFSLAEAYWFLYEVIRGIDVGVVSGADGFYLAGYLFFALALFRSFPGSPARRVLARFAIDGLIVFTSMVGILWILFMRDLADDTTRLVDAILVTAYPALDLALVGLLLFLLRDIRGAQRPRFLLLGLGMLLWALVDTVYAIQALRAGFASGLPVDALWVGGYVAFAAASFLRPGAGADASGHLESPWANVVYIPVPVVAGLAVWEYVETRSMGVVLFSLGIILLMALATRQILVTGELVAAHRRTKRQAWVLEEAQAIAHVGSWEYDFGTDTVMLSPEARRICGFDPEVAKVPRDQFLELVPLKDRSTIDLQRFETEPMRTFEMEHRIRRPDDQTRYVVQRGRTEYHAGRPVRVIGTMQDITERRQFIDQLRFQAKMLDSVGEAIAAADAEGRIVYWNDGAQKMYGWRRDEVVGKAAVDVLPGPDDKDDAEAILAGLARGEPWSGQFPVRRKDGSRILVQVRNDPILDEDGALVGFIGVGRDVTRRVRLEEDLRFQSRLLDSVGQATMATDLEGHIMYWNQAAQEIYGWSKDEVIGRPIVEVTPSQATREQAHQIMEQMARGEPWQGEFEVQRKDGSSFLAQVHNTPVTDAEGRLVGIIGVSHDITERKRLEIDLRERVKEQTALYTLAAEAATATAVQPLIETCVDALEPAFLHADTWVLVQVGSWSASSQGDRPEGGPLVNDFSTALGEGHVEVRYRSEHEDHDVGPFIKEEVALLEGVAELLVSSIDRIHATQEMERREATLVQAQRMAKLGSWIWDPHRDESVWSQQMYVIFERAPDQGPAGIQDALALFKEESREELRGELDRVIQQGGSYMLELELDLPSGRNKTIVSRGKAVKDADGSVATLQGTVQDITEWKQVQESLRFQADLLDEVRHAVIATDVLGHITYWNPAAQTLFGWKPREVIGKPVADILGEQQTAEATDEGGVDQWLPRKDGNKILVNLTTNPLLDADGRLTGFIGVAQDVTRQRQEQRRYQEVVEASPAGIFRTSWDGRIILANPAYAHMAGFASVAELMAEVDNVITLYEHPDDRRRIQAIVKEHGHVEGFEFRIRRPDGAPRTIRADVTLREAESGERVLDGFVEDVTEAREAERRFQDLVDHAPTGILRSTPDGKLDFLNPAGLRMLGYDSLEQAQAEIDDVWTIYAHAADRQRFVESLREPEPQPYAVEVRRRDGSSIWVEVHAQLREDGQGHQFIEGTFHDLTAQRTHLEVLARLASIVESSVEAIYSMDLDGVVETWNRGAEQTFGYRPDEAIGQKLDDLIVPTDHRDEFKEIMQRIRHGRVVPRFETVRHRKDGALIDVSLALTPVRDASGRVVATSVTCHDISDRKLAEEAEKSRLEYEHIKQVDETLRDFINAAAHDLNQPLTPMRLALATLEDYTADMPDSAKNTMQMISRNVDRMALLLQDMLDVARLESGTLRFEIAPTPLAPLLGETADFFALQAEEEGIRLEVEHGFDGKVVADGRRVMQVLFNFVGNAMKFTPEKGTITISSREADGHARVEVTDTGAGLTGEQIGKLFKAFSQVHGPGGPKGTGLGLYISRGIIEKHGGEVGATSQGPGAGSTFWFTLPIAT